MKYFLVVLFLALQTSSAFAKTMTHAELFTEISSKLNRAVFVDIVEPAALNEKESEKAAKLIDSGISSADALKAIVEPLGYGVLEFKETYVVVFNLFLGDAVPGISLEEAKYRILISKAIASKFAISEHEAIDAANTEIFQDLKSGRLKTGEAIPMGEFLKHYPVFRDSLAGLLITDISERTGRVSEAIHRVKDNPASIFWKDIGEAKLLVAYGRFRNTAKAGKPGYVILSSGSVMTQLGMNGMVGTDKKPWLIGGLDFPEDFPVNEFIASIKGNQDIPPPSSLPVSQNSTIGELLGAFKVSVSAGEAWVPKKKIAFFGELKNKEIALSVVKSLYSLEATFDGEDKVVLSPQKVTASKEVDENIKRMVDAVSPELWRTLHYRAVMLSKNDLAKGRSKKGILEGDIFREYLEDGAAIVNVFRKLAYDIRKELDAHKPGPGKYSLEKCSDRVKDDFGLMFYDCLVPIVTELYAKSLSTEDKRFENKLQMFKHLDRYSVKFNPESVNLRSLVFNLINPEGQDQMGARLQSSSFK